MDRVISLLAALVGLIALGGAILVHVNADAQRSELAAEIASLRSSIGTPVVAPAPATPATVAEAQTPAVPGSSESSEPLVATASVASEPAGEAVSSAPPPNGDNAASQIAALTARVADLERINAEQASALADARAQLGAGANAAASSQISVAEASPLAPLSAPASTSAATSSSAPPGAASSAPAAQATDGPTTDCIPLGTRFMGKVGDSFPICKTKAVVKVAGVGDGTADIVGAGPIAAGSFADLSSTKGCTVMVFSADLTGYAEMRVTCE